MNRPGQRVLLIVGLALIAAGALLGVVGAVGDAATNPVASAQGPRQPGFGPGTGRRQPGTGPLFPGRRPFGPRAPNPSPSPSPTS